MNIRERRNNSHPRYFVRAKVFSDTLLNSHSALYTNMFDFLPFPLSGKLRSGAFEWTVNENDSALCRVKLGKSRALPVESTEYGERNERLNARGRERKKGENCNRVARWSIHGEDFSMNGHG